MFSHECIFNSIAIFLSVLTALPQSAKGIRARLFYPPLANRTEKWATVSSSLVLLFPLLFPMLSHGCIFKLIAILLSALTALPQSAKGIRACLFYPLLANHTEKRATVLLSLVLLFPPPLPSVFSQVHFQFNCYFAVGVDGPPSVCKGNNSLPLLSPACKSRREAGDGEFISCLAFPPIPNVFSRVHFQLNCYFAVGINSPSSVCKGNKSPPLLSPACKSHREAGDGEFVSCLAFPSPIPNVFSLVHF